MLPEDTLTNPRLSLRPHHLVCTVCLAGGNACPAIDHAAGQAALTAIRTDPTVAIRLRTEVDAVPHFRTWTPEVIATLRQTAVDRKRDLDVLQRLGLAPGDTRRARYLYSLLFDRIPTTAGLCAHDTPGWEGCELAGNGVYERLRAAGWSTVTNLRSQAEKDAVRAAAAPAVARGERLYLRPHHLMCLSCWLQGEPRSDLRPEDLLTEVCQRIRAEPAVPVVLVEGQCQACDNCDGFHPANGRCVHDCGLLRDYKKDLDLFCRLGLLPGDCLPANELLRRIFEVIGSTRQICGYGDGVVRSQEWVICSSPTGNPGYDATREAYLAGESPF
ncbi:MAG: hypothetical protein IT204_11805 [Fimbriimonadaceae bacterium]|nr:hypothetical protein [Fimbriimonadaceae bacterium]